MEKHLGRKLERWEDVHHIDGNPLNNDLTNLTIMECGEHSRFHRELENEGIEPYDHKKYMRAYNKRHRDDLNAYMRDWRKKNPEKVKEIKHRSYVKCRSR